MQLQVIAYARNGFSQKFGIPRQSREDSHIETHIVFTPEYRIREALRGIEAYSHLWLLWGFHKAYPQGEEAKGEKARGKEVRGDEVRGEEVRGEEARGKESWSPTVRPPRLGGNKRMGVFATRSPFRPNPIGLTSVKLLRVEETNGNGLVLVVSGADLLDGTPIYDIKPYLAFSDSHPQAKSGFAEATQDYHLAVSIDADLLQSALRNHCPWEAIEEILSQDPRPAYQHDPERIYHMDYDGWAVDFTVNSATVCIKNIAKK